MTTISKQYDKCLADKEAKWFAVYTKYKREKRIQRHLQEKGIQTYLPLRLLTRCYQYKKRIVELPLISCYLFTKITKKEYVPVLETPDVVQFVRFGNRMVAIPEEEIQWLKRIVSIGKELEVEPLQYRKGEAVEIVKGELAGIRGILLSEGKEKNLLVELTNTQYALRMHVPPALLRHVENSR